MSSVFISYAKEDAAAAQTIAGALEKAGFTVWWDRHIPPGQTWDEVIGRALDTAGCVLVLWSGTSIESRWVREEAERAASRKSLIPVLIEKVEPPFGFRRIQAADLSGWHGDKRDSEFAELLRAVSELVQATPGRAAVEPEPRPRRLRGKLLWIAAGAMAVAVAAYVAWKIPRGTRTEPPPEVKTAVLPNVIGLPVADGRRVLLSAGFTRVAEEPTVSSGHPPGEIVKQDPAGGTRLPVESPVRLTLATRAPTAPPAKPGSAAVARLPAPRQTAPANGTVLPASPLSATLVWQPVAGARSYSVEHAFLQPGEDCSSITRYSRKVPDIEATSYTFRFGGSRPGCWRVSAIDDRGKEGALSPWWKFAFGATAPVVPDVVGLPLAAARERLLASGITKIGRSRRKSTEAPDTVLEQQPPPGAELPAGGVVRLVIADNPGASWPSREYAGFWRNVSPGAGFIQFIEIAATAPKEVRIRAWLRCNPTPANGGGLDNCLRWDPVSAPVEVGSVHWIYPGDNVGDNTVTMTGSRLEVRTVKAGWRNYFERADPGTIPGRR